MWKKLCAKCILEKKNEKGKYALAFAPIFVCEAAKYKITFEKWEMNAGFGIEKAVVLNVLLCE